MNRVKHTAAFEIAQPANELFPLFSPEGEKLWVPGWDYENVMGSTEIHENYVFITKSHDHASTEAIWLVSRYDPKNHYIKLYKVEPEHKVGIIEIRCFKLSNTSTRVQVAYEYIGLSDKGNLFISSFTNSEFERFVAEWENLLIIYFRDNS